MRGRRRRRPGLGLVLGLAVLGALPACQRAADAPGGGDPRPLVLTTLYPLQEFAREVAGEAVTVASLVPAGAEPHAWEPTPADLARLQAARLFVHGGAGLEPWVDRLLAGLLPAGVVVLNASQGLPLAVADLPGPGGLAADPHVWLDPVLAAAQVRAIAAALTRIDPDRSAAFAANAERYAAALEALHRTFLAGLAHCARRDIVVSHAAYGYLARRYGLTQVPVMGLVPHAEPTPAQLAAVVGFIRRRHVTHVFLEPLARRSLGETLVREAAVQALVLDPVERVTPAQAASGATYLTLMEANLGALRQGLTCR